MKKITIKTIALSLFLLPAFVFAQDAISNGLVNASTFGLPNVDLITFISRLVRIFLSLVVLIVILMIILSGFKWMLSGGDDEKIKKARSSFINSIIGLIIIFISYAIVSFVLRSLAVATS